MTIRADNEGTVLVVDDNAANLSVLFDCLRQANLRVLLAEDGASALNRISRFQPDIILLDIRMPDMSGFDLYQHLKDTKMITDTPVIFLSVVANTAEKVRALQLNAVDYITKPFDPDEVVARVQKHLTLRNLRKRLQEKNLQLQQEIAEREQVEKQLNATLDEKEVLLKEVHHRVKNNLMALSGLIEMQARRTDDPDITQFLQDLQARVRAMGLVHRSLYQSQVLTQIDFGEYLTTLIDDLVYAQGADQQIRWQVIAENVFVDISMAIPCSLIANELITNVIKHAFPQPGPNNEMRVTFTNRNNTYTLQVADNGTGMPEDFDLQTAHSMGITLVRLLATHQLRGSLTLDSQNGATFTLQFAA